MKSPNGKYNVLLGDYAEIGMGSPAFGEITIQGATFNTQGRLFGQVMSFSLDSKFLVIDELINSEAPHTSAMVFDFVRNRQIVVHTQTLGFIKKAEWGASNLLRITSWGRVVGHQEHLWHPSV